MSDTTAGLSKRALMSGGGALAVSLIPELQALAQSAKGQPRLLLGPMVGTPEPDRMTLWGMASAGLPVHVEYADNPDFVGARRSVPVTAAGEEAFVIRPVLSGLKPSTRYWYRVAVDGRVEGSRRPADTFRTAPAAGAQEGFTLGFGSCASYNVDPVQPIWNAIAERNPDLFIHLGDNIYADAQEAFVFDFEYQRQRGLPNYRKLAANLPQVAIWDDHDFGRNDHDRTNPVKDAALDAFKRYWANPAYGLSQTPGVFFRLSYGAVDFFCLDGRYHRDPNAAEIGMGKTILGAEQKAWLKDELKASRAIFKVLACGSGWSMNKGPTGDGWSAFQHERTEIFDFIREEKITGVVLISGDTHIAEFNCIPASQQGGYDLFEFVSSPLANNPSYSWLKRSPDIRLRTPYTSGCNFGLLKFSFEGEPTVSADIVNPSGWEVWPTVELKLGQLQNGVSSWERYKNT